jgi:hypothetical protein
MGHDPARQGDFAGRKPGDGGVEDRVGAGLQQGRQAQLRKAADTARRHGTAKVPLQRRQVGDIDRRSIEADQPAVPVPCPRRSRFGQRPGDPAEQFAQRRFAQAHAGLGDGRLARQSHRRPIPAQPAQALNQFAQHRVIRGVDIERQSHHAIDDEARQQLARAPVRVTGIAQNRIHRIDRHDPRQNTQRYMLTKPMAVDRTATLLTHGR